MGRIAIVTGAGSGIGRAVARALLDAGYSVTLAGRRREQLEESVSGFAPDSALVAPTDVTDAESVAALFAATRQKFGRLDLVFNNAGTGAPPVPVDELPVEEWRRVVDTNLTGVFLCVRAVQGPMRETGYGRIVNIASNTVLAGTPNMAAYVAAKGGVWGFTRALATELGADGVTVNAVAPGLTATEGVLDSPHKEAFDFVQSLQAIPRRGESEDIAPTVAFLCSEEAGWVTGQMIAVDGGHTRH